MPLANWYPDLNRFSLPAPSAWWLQLLRDYDDQLVVLPSRMELVYRLTRRVRAEARLGLKAMIVHEHPDTVMMIQYGVVPVAALTQWSVQSDKIIRDLMARDTWRVFGKPVLDAHDAQRAADMVTARLDAEERTRQREDERRASDMADAAGSDAFRSLQQRKGERIVLSDTHRGYGASPGARRSGWKTVAKATNNSVISPVTSSRPVASPFTSIVLTDR